MKLSKILNDTKIYLNERFNDLKFSSLAWMTIIGFKFWPRSLSGDGVTFGLMEIETLAEFYLKL